MDVQQLEREFPLVAQLQSYHPLFWKNPNYGETVALPKSLADIFDAEARFQRFADYFKVAFPETIADHGILESPLTLTSSMQGYLSQTAPIKGQVWLKRDDLLPISGSIKSRGGIYEVLKIAEKIAMTEGNLVYADNYGVLATERYRSLFSRYGIAVGSTGNLGLSIGVVARRLGFHTTIHMSADAAQWKKDRLRAHGAEVVEYNDNFSNAITQGRRQAEAEPDTFFIDDEGSYDLFIGYAVAGLRLQAQLKALNIKVDADHPLFVYLPAGVGGSPSGVAFGLKMVLGEHVHPIFAEPTHIPSVVLGMSTGLNERISVYDVGIDGVTGADGLAVGRPSRIAGKVMKTLLYGIGTFDEKPMYDAMRALYECEGIQAEPSSVAGYAVLANIAGQLAAEFPMEQAHHIVWCTGGSMMPHDYFEELLKKAK